MSQIKSYNMKEKEEELKQRIRIDLSEWFDMPDGERSGKHILNGQGIRPDILCSPNDQTRSKGFDFDFCIELKIIKRKKLLNTMGKGFIQATNQLHLTTYKDHQPRFALIGAEQSYTGWQPEWVAKAFYAQLMAFNQLNVGWLDMSNGYPVFWMKQVTKPNHRPFWKPGQSPDMDQIKPIRYGSNRSTQKHSNTFKK